MKEVTLYDLLIMKLKDLYSAENMIVEKGLPSMIKVASGELKEAFETHLEQSKEHIRRLEELSKSLKFEFGNEKSAGMEAILKEAEETIKLQLEADALVHALVGAAIKVESYEMAGYTGAILISNKLEHLNIYTILEETLMEEQETSDNLIDIATEDVDEVLGED